MWGTLKLTMDLQPIPFKRHKHLSNILHFQIGKSIQTEWFSHCQFACLVLKSFLIVLCLILHPLQRGICFLFSIQISQILLRTIVLKCPDISHLGEVKVAQLSPTLEILQARILECIAFPFFKGSSQPRDRTQVSLIAGRFFISWATREAQEYWNG